MLFENIKLALTSIKSNKMRTFLTMLGIIIGISSVITVIGLGNGIKNAFNQDAASFGMGKIFVMMNFNGGQMVFTNDEYLTDGDIDAIYRRHSENLIYIQPYYSINGKSYSIVNKSKSYKTSITGVVSGYENGSDIDLKYGRFVNQNDVNTSRNVVVIDDEFAKKVFGMENAVGKNIDIEVGNHSHTFTIIGVYKQSSGILSMAGQTADIYIPSSYYRNYIDSSTSYTAIDICVTLGSDVKKMSKSFKDIIEQRHSRIGQDKYYVNSLESQMGILNNIFNIMTMGLSVIAAISLLVGGIGVMNIMLVSVTERTREIGIRKALGAKYSEIMQQFLMESAIISLFGGVIGVGLGMLFSTLAGAALPLLRNPYPHLNDIIMAFVFSSMVGLVFGLLPARKAAKLNPIDALRYE